MFTGLVATLGRVRAIRRAASAARLTIESDLPVGSMRDGESVAVDGVCLTVARRSGRSFESDVVAETLSRTTLSRLEVGDRVHLERALALEDRLGGHLIQGHVDAVAQVRSLTRRGGDVRLRVAIPGGLRRYVAAKGSIALHGVSLTVAALDRGGLTVALIPETLARTKLGSVKPGDGLNVEVDLIARYLEGLLGARRR